MSIAGEISVGWRDRKVKLAFPLLFPLPSFHGPRFTCSRSKAFSSDEFRAMILKLGEITRVTTTTNRGGGGEKERAAGILEARETDVSAARRNVDRAARRHEAVWCSSQKLLFPYKAPLSRTILFEWLRKMPNWELGIAVSSAAVSFDRGKKKLLFPPLSPR